MNILFQLRCDSVKMVPVDVIMLTKSLIHMMIHTNSNHDWISISQLPRDTPDIAEAGIFFQPQQVQTGDIITVDHNIINKHCAIQVFSCKNIVYRLCRIAMAAGFPTATIFYKNKFYLQVWEHYLCLYAILSLLWWYISTTLLGISLNSLKM